jgi:hypothetical protein
MYLRKLIVSIAHYYLRMTGLILRQPKKNNCITGNLASEARDPGGIRPGNFPDHKFDYLGRAGARVDRGPSGCRDTPCGRARAPGGRRITPCSGPTSARQVRMRRSRVRRMLGGDLGMAPPDFFEHGNRPDAGGPTSGSAQSRDPKPRPRGSGRRRPVGSPGSRAMSFHTCQVLRPRWAARALALTRPSVLPSAFPTASAPGI